MSDQPKPQTLDEALVCLEVEREQNSVLVQQNNGLGKEHLEDLEYLQLLCLRAGYSKEQVEGDSYFVPGIQDLGNMLFEKIAKPNHD